MWRQLARETKRAPLDMSIARRGDSLMLLKEGIVGRGGEEMSAEFSNYVRTMWLGGGVE